jgi:hypothetical protein
MDSRIDETLDNSRRGRFARKRAYGAPVSDCMVELHERTSGLAAMILRIRRQSLDPAQTPENELNCFAARN